MPSESKPFTVEALERERQARLKEAVAGEPANKGKAEKRDALMAQIAEFHHTRPPYPQVPRRAEDGDEDFDDEVWGD